MNKILFIGLLLAVTGCSFHPNDIETAVTTNDSIRDNYYNPRFLFEIDGIRVYRFYDGKSVYFTNKTSNVSYQDTKRSGKITYTEDVQTICSEDKVDIHN